MFGLDYFPPTPHSLRATDIARKWPDFGVRVTASKHAS